MNTNYFLGFAVLLSLSGKAQTISHHVFGADGGYSTGSGGSISWTIGEPVSGTYSSASNITTVGFLQTEQVEIATMLKEQGNEATVLVYPNPVREELKVNFSGLEHGSYALEITDALGKLIYKTKIEISADKNAMSIKVSDYAAGNYFLHISNATFDKSIKITKAN